jgi:hypothetical protein
MRALRFQDYVMFGKEVGGRQMAKRDGNLWELPGRMYEDAELFIL